jgi:hypothetical protein
LVVTRIMPVPALAATVICAGERVTPQEADWLTVKVAVPALTVPVRDAAPAFAKAL